MWVAAAALILMVHMPQAGAQDPATPQTSPQATAPAAAQAPAQAAPAVTTTIKGTVVAGTAGKPGGIPLPGVAVTATNTLTGKKYTTTTDIDGVYAMAIPKTGRYVVKAELAGFALVTQEVVIATADAGKDKEAAFGMELASRAAAAEAATAARTTALARGTQAISLGDLTGDAADASLGTGNTGVTAPSLGGLGDAGDASNESIAVSGGAQPQMNGLAGISEDDLRSRISDAVAQAQASGLIPQGGDTNALVAGALSGLFNAGGPGGGGGRGGAGGGGGGRGGRGGGGGGGGGGAFRNINPAQPHGSIFYQGGNSALNASSWLESAPGVPHFTPNPPAYSNRYGVTIGGSPYLPGLTKPNTKQFVFINLTGQKNLNAFTASTRVPTALERTGDFSQSLQKVNGVAQAVTLYDPKLGTPIAGNNLANASIPISPVALALLNYYPAPNLATTDPTASNYQTDTNAGNNNVAINTRYVRTLGQATNTPFGAFGGGRGGGGGGRGQNNASTKPTLRQNINLSYNYSHSASDQRKIFLPLGGTSESDGNAVNLGYTIGYGRLSNNASATWNRLDSLTRNYFTNTANNPSATAGVTVPNQAGGFANPRFYNGLASLNITNFGGLSNTTPSQTINQTISFSDFVSWRHKKHNLRVGFDLRRVHNDEIGGNNPLGSFSFTGYATESSTDKANTTANGTGAGFADFLLGLPQTTSIQAGLYKIYLRENVLDWYVNDDFRVAANVTLNFGLRYEYFAPYTEKNNRLVNLDHNANFTAVDTVMPGGVGTYGGTYNSSVVNPDKTLYAPRLGIAWRPKALPKLTKDIVIRAGYGINYNTGAFASFAQSLSHQTPFATTQTNTLTSGCTTTTTTTTANMTLAHGFGCSSSYTIPNNYAVDKNYRLGMVQLYNLNIQKTLPLQTVLNVGYNGSYANNLDIYGTPNGTSAGSTIPGVAPFDYETSGATLRSNQLVVSLQKRQQKGIAVGATYTYSHAIDDASAVGNGAAHTPMQNFFNLAGEEGNSSLDQRHNLTGNWLAELPFGPNRAFLNKGGVMSKVLDGFSISGTPQFSGNTAEAGSGNTYTQRPNRNYAVSTKGPGQLFNFFNTAAFSAPASVNGVQQYGTAAVGSIEGPGTVAVTASLSRTVQLKGTNSFEARVTANNVFNTVQYSGISTTENLSTFGYVTGAAGMRSLQVQARYRF
jgi:hypothetical protein